MPHPLDLADVRARYQLAREAGRAMDPTEGDGQLDRARVNALVRAWQDIAPLHDAVQDAARYIAELEKHVLVPPSDIPAVHAAQAAWRQDDVRGWEKNA